MLIMININSAIDSDGQDWSDKLTESEKDSVLELIVEYVCDQGDEYESNEDYDDEN